MGVGINDRNHRPGAKMLVGQRQTLPCTVPASERIDDDPPGRSGDERDVGNVVATDLPNAGGHLKEAVLGVETGLAPQARMHGVR